MEKYYIKESTREECILVDDGIVEYNRKQVPFIQEPEFLGINRVIKNEQGIVLAGINTIMYCWNCLYIDVLWVDENYRKEGYGSLLLKEVERLAIEKGGKLVHLDTFDFQAKDFYLKHGYQVFGELKNCPEGHIRYYMTKQLQEGFE